jgi:hypothetical protein
MKNIITIGILAIAVMMSLVTMVSSPVAYAQEEDENEDRETILPICNKPYETFPGANQSAKANAAGQHARDNGCCYPQLPPGNKPDGTPFGGCGTSAFFSFLRRLMIYLIFYIATPLAVVFVAVGGFVIMFAAGNTSRYEAGKKMITTALTGMVIVYGAFIIINLIFFALTGQYYRAFF